MGASFTTRDVRNCVSPHGFCLPFHHQHAILTPGTNIKATSAPAGSRCRKSYWLSELEQIKIRTKQSHFYIKAKIYIAALSTGLSLA